MPLHPELTAFLELADAALCNGTKQLLHELTPQRAREEYDRVSAALDIPSPAVSRVENLRLPSRDGRTLLARLYLPSPKETRAREPVLLFFHGGGFVVGSLDSHDILCCSLAAKTPCAVLSLQYRLAPEHRFPAPIEDAEDALIWLGLHAAHFSLDSTRIVIGGDSAGGTIAAALALIARDDPAFVNLQPKMQLLLYPSVSATQSAASHRRFGEGYLLESATIDWFFQHYLRAPSDRNDWRFSPLSAPNVSGVAPAHMVLAEFDPLVDEGLAYAAKLTAAGVSATVKCYPGMVHDFMRLGGIVRDEVLRAHEEVARVLSEAFE
jgi:acetyl esterase